MLLRSGRFELPFGSIDITLDPATARWGDLALSEFTPADELRNKGLQNRYRQRGIGAPLAADAAAAAVFVTPHLGEVAKFLEGHARIGGAEIVGVIG